MGVIDTPPSVYGIFPREMKFELSPDWSWSDVLRARWISLILTCLSNRKHRVGPLPKCMQLALPTTSWSSISTFPDLVWPSRSHEYSRDALFAANTENELNASNTIKNFFINFPFCSVVLLLNCNVSQSLVGKKITTLLSSRILRNWTVTGRLWKESGGTNRTWTCNHPVMSREL